MRQKLAAYGTGLLRRKPIQSCFVCSGSQQGANFLSLEEVFYNEWKYNAAFIYPSSFTLRRCWLPFFTPVTWLSKLPEIHSVAALPPCRSAKSIGY